MFKVYDTVWVMENNKPTKKMVFAVIESMDYFKTGVEMLYRLVDSRVGAGWGNNDGIRYEGSEIFSTQEALLDSLKGE